MEEVINKIRKYFKNDEEYFTYDNLDVQYILTDKDKKITDIICYGDDVIGYYDLDAGKFNNIFDWDYNVDTYLFEELEKGKELAFVSPIAHYDIWNIVNDWYPEDIEYKNGLSKYLEYCKNNGITKEFIDKEVKLDTIDIFKVIEEKTKEEIKYYITDYLDKDKKQKIIENGLYCYGLRSSEDAIIATIEENVLVNNVGIMITNKKLDFKDKDYIDFNEFVSKPENIQLSKISNFTNKSKEKNEMEER